MRLHAIGGLCNRLQAMLSRRAAHGPISVFWEKSDTVSHAHFLDVFEPIEGIQFVNDGWDAEAWDVAREAPRGWERAYQELAPLTGLEKRITRVQSELGDYLAIHVRRTDHVPNTTSRGERVEALDEYVEWSRQYAGLPIYVATDNGETQQSLQAMLAKAGRVTIVGACLDGNEWQANGNQHRNGSLADAVADLFVCAGATHFKGTRFSSFSDTIERLMLELP
jgi:hypothetical protein